MYLGLDVQADISSYTLQPADPKEKPSHGRVNLEGFAQLLQDARPRFMACEFTGRLAVPYAKLARAHGVPCYFLDTVSRAAYTRIFGQTSKTDKQDAKTIAAVFRRWAEHEAEYTMNQHLFLDSEMVEDAWQLRAMLAEAKKVKQFQTSCLLKAQIAERTHLPDIQARWERIGAALPVKEVDGEVEGFAREMFGPEMELLQTVPGIGPVLAPWLIATLHPVSRFDSYAKAKRYIGMNPRQTDTGKKVGKQKVSRTGSAALRGLLYIAALGQVGLKDGKQTKFGAIYERKKAAGMPGKKAAVAVAEAIFCTAFHVLRSGQPYHDAARPAAPAPEARPGHLVPQAEAARLLGISRQAISLQVKSGKLRAEEWQGKLYPVRKYVDLAVAEKEGAA